MRHRRPDWLGLWVVAAGYGFLIGAAVLAVWLNS